MASKKYYQIGQLCELTGLNHSTIRFWEEKFRAVRPMRSSGGHRYYSAEQLNIILYLKKLLYEDKFTIEGANKKLNEDLRNNAPMFLNSTNNDNCSVKNVLQKENTELLNEIKNELKIILAMLKS